MCNWNSVLVSVIMAYFLFCGGVEKLEVESIIEKKKVFELIMEFILLSVAKLYLAVDCDYVLSP